MDKQEKKTSVLLYADWAEPLRSLPLEEIGKLFLGILDYVRTGASPAFDSPGTAMAWQFIRMRLDDNLEKWDATREKRRQAGRLGADVTNGKERQKTANPANAAFAEPEAAKPAVPVPEPEPEPVPDPVPVPAPAPAPAPVPGAAEAAREHPPEGGPPPLPSIEPENRDSPEARWVALGLGKTAGPAIRQMLQSYREAGMEDGLLVQAMEEAAAHPVKAPAAYLRSILDRCRAEGILTLEAWQARQRPPGGGKRVDRATPSGNDFLADAITRPRRHKRKDE